MRIYLCLLLWIVCAALSIPAAATAMAHCQTQQTAVTHTVLSSELSFALPQTISLEPASAIDTVTFTAMSDMSQVATDAMQLYFEHPAVQNGVGLHHCCDEATDQHQCAGHCPNCDGCTTAHHFAMPVLGLFKTTMIQPKIQYIAYSYLSLQRSTQERPPRI